MKTNLLELVMSDWYEVNVTVKGPVFGLHTAAWVPVGGFTH